MKNEDIKEEEILVSSEDEEELNVGFVCPGRIIRPQLKKMLMFKQGKTNTSGPFILLLPPLLFKFSHWSYPAVLFNLLNDLVCKSLPHFRFYPQNTAGRLPPIQFGL